LSVFFVRFERVGALHQPRTLRVLRVRCLLKHSLPLVI